MKKIHLTLCMLLFTVVGSFAGAIAQTQTVYEMRNDIPVTVNGHLLRAAWAGGLNSPQFNAIDLDQDGFRDLVIFDRLDQAVLTFKNGGASAGPDYTFAPEFISAFPPDLSEWMLLADFDQDGYEDIFTNLPGTSNIRVFRNTTATNGGQLAFTLFKDTLYSDYQPYIPLYSAKSDIPALIDVDEDGDLDIITFHLAGRDIEWHRNMSVENYNDLQHLEFFVQSHCFGHVEESPSSCDLTLNVPPCNPGERFTLPGPADRGAGIHTGSTLLALDLNGDSLKELLVGDVNCSNITSLVNAGTLEIAHFDYEDESFPSNNTPINIPVFPATFFLDLDNDGRRDLVAAPNRTVDMEDVSGVSWHRNTGTDASPSFAFRGFGLMQEEMIETGSGAVPVFFDYNGDGLQDLLIGNLGRWDSLDHSLSYLQLFLNTGTAQQPAFTRSDSNFLNLLGSPLVAPDEYLSPALADLDGDGDEDLFLGKADGQLNYFRNDGGPGGPAVFVFVTGNFGGIDAGLYSAPEFYDLDQDGDLDLLLGNHRGWVQYYENTGNASNASLVKVSDSLGGVKVNDFTGSPLSNGFARPRIVDVDGDGLPNLLVGTVEGTIEVFAGVSSGPGAVFTPEGNLFQRDFGGYVAVAAAVLDSARLTYVVGTRRGGLMLMRSSGVVGAGESSVPAPVAMSLWPNPVTDVMHVALEGAAGQKNLELEVWDLAGRRLLSRPFNGQESEVDLQSIPAGMYVLILQGQKMALRKNFVKLK